MRGLFITFEGSEGSGKSTQSKLLCQYLKKKGHSVVHVREPGGTAISEKIRGVLLDGKNKSMAAPCEMLLYMAARAQVVSEIIIPALRAGNIVVCDRFLDSTLAYQGYGLGVDRGLIRAIGKFATTGLTPDITIVLDLPVEAGLRHRHGSPDRIEQRSVAYHRRVRQGYLALARQAPRRIKVVAVDDHKLHTQQNIRAIISNVIARVTRTA